jgi:UDP-N-acetylglucosamine 1-carboxyvinyltransferase
LDRFQISGGRTLRGRVRVAGAKNAALPALAAGLLTGDPLHLTNLPDVRDIATMRRLLDHLSGEAPAPPQEAPVLGEATIQVRRIAEPEAPWELVRTMRASVLVLGPLLARAGRARVSLPGGCAIGERPVDLHITALRRMGASIDLAHGYIDAHAPRLRGAEIDFEIPTVTGTENLMMAASLADGTTVLRNCAKEPEITDLAGLLHSMGARIRGAGGDTIEIEGVSALHGAEHRIPPDRIEAGTYILAALMAGDGVVVEGCAVDDLSAPLELFREAGARIAEEDGAVRVEGGGRLLAKDITTAPYPGFPTDLQAQYMAAMTQAEGASIVTEAIFENRFMHIGELRRMGADITHDGRTAVVRGPTQLSGAQVMATDLRASASLVLAGLVADGITEVNRVYHIDRGYESIESKLRALGADIERVSG